MHSQCCLQHYVGVAGALCRGWVVPQHSWCMLMDIEICISYSLYQSMWSTAFFVDGHWSYNLPIVLQIAQVYWFGF